MLWHYDEFIMSFKFKKIMRNSGTCFLTLSEPCLKTAQRPRGSVQTGFHSYMFTYLKSLLYLTLDISFCYHGQLKSSQLNSFLITFIIIFLKEDKKAYWHSCIAHMGVTLPHSFLHVKFFRVPRWKPVTK